MRKHKRDTDINTKLAGNIRRRILLVIRDNKKSQNTMNLIGCDLETLRSWFEDWFSLPENEGMTWDNYGKGGWHIDHILPCSAFELQYSEEQEVCFHYTNLQPLWWYDNFAKSDKVQEVV